MLLTEAEAKAKWCPFSRVLPAELINGTMYGKPMGIAAHNRVQEAREKEATWHGAMNCLGSACMAWRWADRKRHGDGCPNLNADDCKCPRVGRCGMAGA